MNNQLNIAAGAAITPILPAATETAIPPAVAHFSGVPMDETLELISNCACWPPPTRRAAIGLWCSEVGMHPCEFWDVAAALLAAQPGEVAA